MLIGNQDKPKNTKVNADASPKIGKPGESNLNARGFSTKATSNYVGVSESALRQQRMDRERKNRLPLIPYVRAGRKIIYLKDDLDRWLEAHRIDKEKNINK